MSDITAKVVNRDPFVEIPVPSRWTGGYVLNAPLTLGVDDARALMYALDEALNGPTPEDQEFEWISDGR